MDVYETEIKVKIKVHFNFDLRELPTHHSDGCPAHIEIDAIEIYGQKVPWDVTKEIRAHHEQEIEEEILDLAWRAGR